MHRLILLAGLVVTLPAPVMAQTWAPWYQPSLLDPPRARPEPPPRAAALTPPFYDPDDDYDYDQGSTAVLSGGPKPTVQPEAPRTVRYASGQPAGTIVIDNRARRLYLVRSASTALSYPVSVGREGFRWTGTEKISRIASWPDWHPPVEMRKRDPRLPVKMTGGVRNPLGAKALYLGNTLYRIHGTSDARTIGQAASSGCFRMYNRHVVDLARRVGVGTRVVVINASSRSASSYE